MRKLRSTIALSFGEQGGGEFYDIVESDPGIAQCAAVIMETVNGIVERNGELRTSQPTVASPLAKRTCSPEKSTTPTSTISIISLREWIKDTMEEADFSFLLTDPLASSSCDGDDF